MRNHLLTATALVAALVSPPVAHGEPGDPTAGYAIVDRIAGPDGGWDYASFDPDSGRLYVARTNAVMAVDLASHHVIDSLAPAEGAHSAFAIDAGRTVVETDGRSGLVRFLAAADGQVLGQVASGKKPDAAVFDPVSGRVVVMNPGSDTITEIDPVKHQVVATIAVAGGVEGAATDGRGHVFTNLEDAGALVEIDSVAGKVLRTTPLGGCEGPTGIALASGGTLAISACANGLAVVTDTATGHILGSVAIDRGPDFVLVDEPRKLAFFPCGESGTLVVLSTADREHPRVVGRVRTQVGARTGAIDPKTGRIYLPAATMGPLQPGARHGKPVPGSFVVLVVAPQP